MPTAPTVPAAAQKIVGWLRECLTISEAKGLVVGLSGGVDSAVVARLCQLAAPDGVLGVLLPCHSDPQDEADARLTADHFSMPIVRVDLVPAYDALIRDLDQALRTVATPLEAVPDDPRSRVPAANIKPRLRMASLYYFANSLNYLVAGTGNRSEIAIGYYTKYGDGGVDVLPIGNLLKRQVRALARELEVPARIIEKTPTAGLWLGQTDEQEMGFSYAVLEGYLDDGPDTIAPALALRIERLMRRSDHKRTVPPIPEIEA